MPEETAISALQRRSLAVKLPLGIALLLAFACIALTLIAFLQVWRSAFDEASARLSSAARQVAALVEPGIRARVEALQQVADGAAVRALLTARTPDTEAAVLNELARQASAGRVGWRFVDAAGQPLLTSPSWTPQPGDDAPRTALARGVGLFRKASNEDYVYYEVTAPVPDQERPLAYLIERRWITERAPSVDLLARLIGDDTRLVMGNTAGDGWTDFARSIAPLPATILSDLVTVSPPGEPSFVARGVAVPGTPWIAAVTVPRATVLAPARTFLTRALYITLGVLVVGAIAGWVFSRRLIRPLRRVAESAERIAAGDRQDTRARPRGDEVDRLAASFTAMSDRVHETQQSLAALVEELEVRVKARTAALESANEELEAFNYSVSHDLRAPIRAVSGFATILLEDHGHTLTPEARQCVELIATRGQHLSQLIDDLLAFSLAGRHAIHRQPIDMMRLSATVAGDFKSQSRDRQVDFLVGEMPAVRGEPALIRQVLTNLLDNAFKFTSPRSAARIEVGAQSKNGDDPVYYVRDNGVGFDMRQAGRLFGVFQRLHTQQEFEGSGVGLAIVQRIVQRHGGRVWAEAAVDRGATFYFTLPQSEPASSVPLTPTTHFP